MPEILKPNDPVEITHDRQPASMGIVVMVSVCGKYARVRELHGAKTKIQDYSVNKLHYIGPAHNKID